MRIQYTSHARLRTIERGISASEVRTALLRGRDTRVGPKGVAAYMYFHVVYRKVDQDYVVITVIVPR